MKDYRVTKNVIFLIILLMICAIIAKRAWGEDEVITTHDLESGEIRTKIELSKDHDSRTLYDVEDGSIEVEFNRRFGLGELRESGGEESIEDSGGSDDSPRFSPFYD